MDGKRELRSPSPDSSGSDTVGPPTPQASRSQSAKTTKPADSSAAKTVAMADSLESLKKRQHLSLYGCKLCGPVANCTCVAARGYNTETALACKDSIRGEAAEEFADRNPQKALEEEMDKMDAETEFQELSSKNAKSPFCCGKLVHIERDGSGEFLEEGRREPILKFVNDIDTATFRNCIDQMSDGELKAVQELYRVNRVGDDSNKATYIYVPIQQDDRAAEGYMSILKIDPPHAFERFGGPKTGGKNGFLAFRCPVHKHKFHVGYSKFHYIGKNKTVATFGDGRLDALMKVPRLEKLVLGYGGMGF